MRKIVFVTLLSLLLTEAAMAGEFSLTSPQLRNGGRIADQQVFDGFGCHGGNISPALQWKNTPAGTKSFAVTVYDPDAPTGSGWWHWLIFNISAKATGLAKDAGNRQAKLAPSGSIQSRTDYGKPGYGGPCPPVGDKPHHYLFTVYALKIDKLPLDENAPAAMVGYYLHQNVIRKAVLKAVYGR